MQTFSESLIGIVVILFFIWRFARTHQIYRYTLHAHRDGIGDEKFTPSASKEFFSRALLGNHSAKPNSFFIRAFVFVIVAVVLLPFKDYAPDLYLVFILLIVLYIPWCIGHGLWLKNQLKIERSV